MSLAVTAITDNGNGTASVTITSSGLSNTCYVSPDNDVQPVWTQFGNSISGAGTFGPVTKSPGDYFVYVYLAANSISPFTDIISAPMRLTVTDTAAISGENDLQYTIPSSVLDFTVTAEGD